MEKYVVSRELAEQLKAAKFPQETQYRYYIGDGYDGKLLNEHDWNEHFADEAIREGDIVATPLSDELLEALPFALVEPTETEGVIHFDRLTLVAEDDDEFYVGYKNHHTINESMKLTDALAQLWLWANQHNHIPAADRPEGAV